MLQRRNANERGAHRPSLAPPPTPAPARSDPMPLENRIQLPVKGLTHTHRPKSLDHISHWPVERHAANPANLDLTPANLTSSPAAALMAARGHRLPPPPCALLVSRVLCRYRVCQRALNYPWFGTTGIAAPVLCSCRLRHGCFVETLSLGINFTFKAVQ